MNVVAKTGPDFEEVVTGVRSNGSGIRRARVTFFDAVEIAKRKQPTGWCPDCPKRRIAKALYNRVASVLGKEKKHLKLYVAIQTIMDTMYGVDLFFQYKEAIVTVDLTISRHKVRPKADFVITKRDVEKDVGFYKKADMIANALKGGWFKKSQMMTETEKMLSRILIQYLKIFSKIHSFDSKILFSVFKLHSDIIRSLHEE